MQEYEPDTTHHPSEASTECFSFDSEIAEFQNDHKCVICKLHNPDALELANSINSNDGDDSIHLIQNIVWLKCQHCHLLFHLQCIDLLINIDKLLKILEQGYICEICV